MSNSSDPLKVLCNQCPAAWKNEVLGRQKHLPEDTHAQILGFATMIATPDQNLRRNEFSNLKLSETFFMNIVQVPWRTKCRVGNSNHQIVLVPKISVLGDGTYQARTIRAQTIKFETRNPPLCECPPGALEDEALGR
jgi:hypothetical protein